MHSTTMLTTLLSLAAPLTIAAPAPQKHQSASSGPVVLIAAHSTSPIHLQAITASNSTFFIGKPTVSYCPTDVVSTCPPGNTTAIEVNSGGASMDVEVPGGQRIYVFPTGALAYTPAHAEGESSVNNGTTAGFVYVNGTEAGQLGSLTFEGGDWLACPVDGGESTATTGPWQVFAALPTISNNDVPGKNVSACINFDALGSPFTDGVAAWQYD